VRSAEAGQFVIGSFQGTKWDDASGDEYDRDWVLGARLVKETGVPMLEANLSCPNEGKAHLLCYDVPRVAKIVDAIKNEIGDTPLKVKIGYFNEVALREFVSEVGPLVQGISAINTIPAEVRNQSGEQALPGQGRLISGVCGDSIRAAGLSMVERLKVLREEMNLSFKITGVGGVMTAEDYVSYRKLGADYVMSATGAMWRPTLASEVRAVAIS
jgi:dihydroorotate dehydrogenase